MAPELKNNYLERKKWSHFDLKSWVSGGNKIRPGILNHWRISESNWLDIESQIDSNILQLLGIPGQILVPPLTQLLRSNDSIFLSVKKSLQIFFLGNLSLQEFATVGKDHTLVQMEHLIYFVISRMSSISK